MTAKPKVSQLRIIGGRWRGRKIAFPPVPGLRPTPDRVRETLFNWLAPDIRQARCLDLFAGSGALGLEALSRGASQVTFVDSHPQVIKQLQQNIALLQAEEQTDIVQGKFPDIALAQQAFDIIFLDPPFNQGYIAECFKWIESHNLAKIGTKIYCETEKQLTTLPLPADWQICKNKTAGDVNYTLIAKGKD